MKKTIAILLILVIGMVGVFADDLIVSVAGQVDGLENSNQADIVLYTTVEEFALFALSAVDYTSVSFTSKSAFEGDKNLYSTLVRNDLDLDDFKGYVNLANIWGINNTKGKITLTVSAGDGFVGEDNAKIALTVAPTGFEIPAASGTTLGILNTSNVISAIASNTALIDTAAAQDYEATITITVTSGS
jgi:hypothetical protein